VQTAREIPPIASYDMDESTRIIGELQQKLHELDQRVLNYRRDMASEYSKYAEGLLRDVPEDVSKAVSKAMLESLKEYPSLFPEDHNMPQGCEARSDSASDKNSSGTKPSHISLPAINTAGPSDEPRSPHEREKEFQGLFTPSYLPLLDSAGNDMKNSTSDSPIPIIAHDDQGKSSATPPTMEVCSSEATQTVSTPEVATKPPTPLRKNTDELSVMSDNSDSRSPRRSALRRSPSSISKGQSPRRVRFDFDGAEVLPTASPEPPVYLDEVNQRNPIILGYTGEDSSDDEAGSQQVEDITAVDPPPPKRTSSSQALRSLSRTPLEDDGTKWTEVVAPADGSPSVPAKEAHEYIKPEDTAKEATLPATNDSPTRENQKPPSALINNVSPIIPSQGPYSAKEFKPSPNGRITMNRPSSSDSLKLPLPQSPTKIPGAASVSILSPAIPNGSLSQSFTAPSPARQKLSLDVEPSPVVSSNETKEDLKFDDSEDDALFEFDDYEEDSKESPSRSNQNHDSSSIPDPPSSGVRREPSSDISLTQMATSPARTIPAPNNGQYIDPSYKGRKQSDYYAFREPVVKPHVHEQAASLGPVSSFIGSVDGRSGVDASDVKTFRASGLGMNVGSFRGGSFRGGSFRGGSFMGAGDGGAPRSFSERMIMEEMAEGSPAN
jgi:hypothetical protein